MLIETLPIEILGLIIKNLGYGSIYISCLVNKKWNIIGKSVYKDKFKKEKKEEKKYFRQQKRKCNLIIIIKSLIENSYFNLIEFIFEIHSISVIKRENKLDYENSKEDFEINKNNLKFGIISEDQADELILIAILCGNKIILNFLISKGFGVSNFSLNISAEKGHFEIAAYLIEKEICYPDAYCFGFCIMGGNLDMVKLLHSIKAPHFNVCRHATECKKYDILKFLIENQYSFDRSLCEKIGRDGNRDMLLYLEKKVGLSPEILGPIAESGNIDLLKEFMLKGYDIKFDTLYFALCSKNLEMIKFIITRIDVDKLEIKTIVNDNIIFYTLEIIEYFYEENYLDLESIRNEICDGNKVNIELVSWINKKQPLDISIFKNAVKNYCKELLIFFEEIGFIEQMSLKEKEMICQFAKRENSEETEESLKWLQKRGFPLDDKYSDEDQILYHNL